MSNARTRRLFLENTGGHFLDHAKTLIEDTAKVSQSEGKDQTERTSRRSDLVVPAMFAELESPQPLLQATAH